MLAADTVRRTAHAQCQRRQTKWLGRISRIRATKTEKFLVTETQLLFISRAKGTFYQLNPEFVVACCDWRVRGEHAALAHQRHCFRKIQTSRVHRLARQLER